MTSDKECVLKTMVAQLESHFTWALRKEDIQDITEFQIRLEDAIKFFESRVSGVIHSYCCLAYTRYLQGFPEEAMENLQKAEDLTKQHYGVDCEKRLIVIYGDLAWLHYHMLDYAKCQTCLDKLALIAEKFPLGSGSVLHPEVYNEKGRTFLKFTKKYHDIALECFKKALELEWNEDYAFALHCTEEEVSSAQDSPAIKQLRRAIEMMPGNGFLLVLLALQLCHYKQFPEADKLVERAQNMSPDPKVKWYIVKYLRIKGKLGQSIGLLMEFLEYTSLPALTHHQLGLCHKEKYRLLKGRAWCPGEDDEMTEHKRQCIYHLEKAISLRPSSSIYAMKDLAVGYGMFGDLDRAETMFCNAFEAARDKEEFQQLHSSYGYFQQKQRRCESLAIEHYTKALHLNKDTFSWRCSASNLREMANRRIRRDPQDGEAYGLLGLVFKIQGDNVQAVKCYEKALECDRENDEFLSALCDLRLALQ